MLHGLVVCIWSARCISLAAVRPVPAVSGGAGYSTSAHPLCIVGLWRLSALREQGKKGGEVLRPHAALRAKGSGNGRRSAIGSRALRG